MNYEYQYLLQQIKSIANKEHVVSSNRAKSAEEITNGSLSVVVDIIQKYFAFKCSGLSEPVYIDPIGQRILNIKYINDVNVEELIGGITNGYGITIEEQPGGVYKVSVVDNMFALQEDVDDITSKFDEYTTTEELEQNYYNKTDTDATFLKKNGLNTYEGTLTINNSTTTDTFLKPFRVLNSDMLSNSNIAICVGKSLSAECCAYFYYTEPYTGVLGLAGYTNIINYNKSTINLNKPTTITGNLAVQNGEINMLNSNLTENSVNRIAVGKALTNAKCSYIGYKEPGIGYLGVFGNALIITWTKDLIKLEKPTTITGNLTVSGSIINNELDNRLTTIESMFKYNQTIVEENIGETLTEYLSNKDKTYGIVLANPANKSYTYVMFQSLINSGFILRCNGTSSIAFKFYGSNESLQPYKVDWITWQKNRLLEKSKRGLFDLEGQRLLTMHRKPIKLFE